MEEVLVWLLLIPVEYRRLLWFRAEGWSWRKLDCYFDCGSRQVRLRWRDGIVSLWENPRGGTPILGSHRRSIRFVLTVLLRAEQV